MQTRSLSHAIRSYFEAYNTKNRQVVEALLADDFRFTSPYDDQIDRAAYFARCWANAERIKAIRIEEIAPVADFPVADLTGGDAAFVRYTVETTAGARFRNVEYHRFEDGRLKTVEVYFGELPAR